MARELGRSCRLDPAMEIAAREALRALEAASVSISRLEAGVGLVRTLLNVGDLGPTEVERPADETYRLAEFTQLAALIDDLKVWTTSIDDPSADQAELALLHELEKGSSLGAPLVVDGVLWGEFYATRRVGEPVFAEAELAYVETLAAILGGAISRAAREETLVRLAYRDPLTGLANRRAIDEAIRRIELSGPAGGARISFVMIDVNGLKQVNDTHGHQAGDRVLTAVAGLLNEHFGALHGTLIARIGGDEFAVLVPDQPLERVVSAAWAMTGGCDGLPHGAGLACGITSHGVGTKGVSAADLYRSADAAQYSAKRSGLRSSVAVAGD
jgi:diguanylate cyclase (GGDEF)-like protein